jgi:hypothetical protein
MMKYVLMYYGAPAESEDERAIGMRKMAEWYGRLGAAVVDAGNPFTGGAKTVGQGGTVKDGPIGQLPTGYTILQADTLAAATELARGCPLLQSGRQITVLEAFTAR